MGLRALFTVIGVDLPGSGVVVPSSAIVAGMIAGIVVTVISAVAPAINASRIPPVAALRDTQIERAPRKVLRFGIGAAILLLGLVNLFSGLFGHPGNAL